MDVVCRPDIPCFCRPLTTPELLAEHVLLGSVQLAKAVLLSLWLHVQQGAQIAISTQLPLSGSSSAAQSPHLLHAGGNRQHRTSPPGGSARLAAASIAGTAAVAAGVSVAAGGRASHLRPVQPAAHGTGSPDAAGGPDGALAAAADAPGPGGAAAASCAAPSGGGVGGGMLSERHSSSTASPCQRNRSGLLHDSARAIRAAAANLASRPSHRRARFVLPVYHRFLTYEAWQCCIWGFFYLSQSYYDWSADGRPVVTVLFQLVRYLSSFTMAVSGEGVFFFLACRSASTSTLLSCITAAAVWACLLTACSALLFLWWAGCTPLPQGGYEEILWIAGWFPYWLRLAIMPFAYPLAGIYLLLTRPSIAWERGALLLALFNFVSSSVFVLTKVYFGVLVPDFVRLQDGLATPLIWLVYVPFLIWVLQRDSDYWCRAGFMACIVEEGRDISELKSARREACERTPLSAGVRTSSPFVASRFRLRSCAAGAVNNCSGACATVDESATGGAGLRAPLLPPAAVGGAGDGSADGAGRSEQQRSSPASSEGGGGGSGAQTDEHDARFLIINPAHIQWGRTIGRGASSTVSSAVLYGHHVAIKELRISYLTREFATAFLAEAEFLSRCRHPNIVAFIGGCVSPPKVALLMELCRTSVHSLIHCPRTRALVLGPAAMLHGGGGGSAAVGHLAAAGGGGRAGGGGGGRAGAQRAGAYGFGGGGNGGGGGCFGGGSQHALPQVPPSSSTPVASTVSAAAATAASADSCLGDLAAAEGGGRDGGRRLGAGNVGGGKMGTGRSARYGPPSHAGSHGGGPGSDAPALAGLPSETICMYLHDVVQGMHFLHHTMGIVHGDLKPLNMLLKNGRIKLCDFGCASTLRAVSAGDGAGGVGAEGEGGFLFAAAAARYVGTLPYCAPEVIESPVRLLPSADVYSLGVALWEMCTGLYPWEDLLAGGRLKELKQRVATFAERPNAQSCPPPLQTLMKACWSASPSSRPTFDELASIDMATLCTSVGTLHQLHLAVWKRCK